MAAIAAIAVAAIGFAAGKRTGAPPGSAATEWTGELLGGPLVAMAPRVSHDGQYVAFEAFVDGLTQLAVLKPKTGDWAVLTSDRTHGLLGDPTWSLDDSKIYFSRRLEVPNGVYSISPLGTGERLLLAEAQSPEELSDGSLLVARMNADRNIQLYRFFPGTGRLDTLNALLAQSTSSDLMRPFRDGKQIAFFGRPKSTPNAADQLYVTDLATKEFRRLAPTLNLPVRSFGISTDDQSVVVQSGGALTGLLAIARDGSNRAHAVASLMGYPAGVDFGSDGSLYVDAGLRPAQLMRYSPADHKVESRPLAYYSGAPGTAVALADGRAAVAVPAGAGFRVMVISPGKDATPFMGTDEETNAPVAMLGADRVMLIIGTGQKQALAITSMQTGQVLKRFAGLAPSSIAGSPDGKTLYFADTSRFIWSMPADGSEKRTKIRGGDAVAIDPHGKYLIVAFNDKTKTRLFRVPLDGTKEEEIEVHGDLHVSSFGSISANAVGPDGRIVLSVVPKNSWFWPLAILDPKTGKLEVLPPGDQYDMGGGWTSDGHIVYLAHPVTSTLWRMRPTGSKK
jgi:DNA-binding beta-propeller fold protein YncE